MLVTPHFLMVSADCFDVSYTINPWMRPEHWQRDPHAMHAQAMTASAALRSSIEHAGGIVEMADGVPGLPDMVFPANAAVVLDGKVLLARFRYPERQGEEAHFRQIFEALRERGIVRDIVELPPGCFQEGAGDAIWDAGRGHFWAGYGPRSSLEATSVISATFDKPVVALELASERCYHLDVCFCLLSGGDILYLPSAFTPQALRTLRRHVHPDMLIEATEDDLLHFNINAVSVGRDIIMSLCTPSLRARLQARGYHVTEVDLAPFMLSGGGAYCMTLRLDRTSTTASSLPATVASCTEM